jgi:hypothetical protein
MNRLSPLIRRKRRTVAAAFASPRDAVLIEAADRWIADAKLFAAGWVSGLVVFGTLLA